MAREKQQQLFRFPMKGIHVVGMKNEQPEGTCYDALNVRPFDTIESRARGGSRPGLVKHNSSRSSANRIQDLNYVTAISSTIVATSLSRRTITPVMVCNGVISTFDAGSTVTNATVTGNSALGNAAQSPFAFSTELFQRLYYADGRAYKIFVPTNTSAIDWTPTAGTLPGDEANSIVCRLIETWRGRIVLSGLATDPHNWFMSKLGDPLDWDYGPTVVTELDAVQGGAGFVGKVPDIINCIIPYNDDVLLFGCDHSIWMMSGDPQAGGRLDLITNTVGIAFGRPYTQLPDGTLIFFSSGGGVYRMAPGQGKPESISRNNIDPLILNTNLNTNLIRMAYDEGDDGVHMFIKPLAANTNTTHYFYDLRNQGWFKVQYGSNDYDPVAICIFDGDSPSDRVMLIGGGDGYVRKHSTSVFQDDSTDFTSYVTMGPIVADAGRYPCILTDLQFVMDNSSGTTIFELGVGDTAETALADFEATFTGEVTMNGATISIPAGRGYNINPRTRGYFQYFKVGALTPNAAWAIEYIQSSYSIVRSSRGRTAVIEVNYSYRRPDGPPLLNTQGLWAAYWADQDWYTLTGSNLNTLLVSQQGTSGDPPTITIDVGTLEVNTADTLFNGKPSIAIGGSDILNCVAPNTSSNLDVTNGFVTVVLYKNNATSISNMFVFSNAANTGQGTWACQISGANFQIADTFGAGNTQTSSTGYLTNAAFVLTFGKSAADGWIIRQNGTTVKTSNLNKFWNDVDNASGIYFNIKGAAGAEFKLASMAIYNVYNSSVVTAVENAVAQYYNITF